MYDHAMRWVRRWDWTHSVTLQARGKDGLGEGAAGLALVLCRGAQCQVLCVLSQRGSISSAGPGGSESRLCPFINVKFVRAALCDSSRAARPAWSSPTCPPPDAFSRK
eukprot:4417745-Prymnesium_polylepis.1